MNITKTLWIFAVTIIAATPAFAQNDPAIAEGMRISPITRATVFVRDIDESLKLYRDILGLKPRVETTLSSERVNELLGTTGEAIKVSILNATGSDWTGDVGLLQYVGEQNQEPVVKAPRIATGDVALVFITEDILGVAEDVRAAGYTIIAGPSNPRGETGPDASYEFLFFDRDGIIVNLIQRDVSVRP